MFRIITPDKAKPFTIGRKEGSDLLFTERFVSREHAIIEFNGSAWNIRSLTTNSFTLVNDVQVEEETALRDGDVIGIGVKQLHVNLKGTIRFTERFLESPALRSVLFIASASARNGAEFPFYVASKAGLVGYMKNLALKLAERGITCNSISPGGVITPMNRHILEDKGLYAAVKAETLLGKWCEPEEIADLAWYLTAVNRSITGEDILIDNGEMLKSHFIW